MFKVICCGSRNWNNYKTIRSRLEKLDSNSTIIEGGCSGADLMCRHIALDIGLEVVEFPAAWKKYGRSAGPKRNIKMLNTGPDLLIAFHKNISSSKGTKHIVEEAKKRGIKVEIIDG